LALSSDSLPESQIYISATPSCAPNWRPLPAPRSPFHSAASSAGAGDLDPQALRANGLSANDVVSAIGAQNLILRPARQKMGALEYFIKLNASPNQIEDLNNLPIRTHNGTVTYVHDVAHVRDGYSPQTSMVRLEGRRAVLMRRFEDWQGVHDRHHQQPSIKSCRRSAHRCPPI